MKDLAAGAGAVVEGVGVVVAAEVATTAIQRIATDDTGITATMQMSTAEAEDVGVDVGAVEGVGVANGEAEEQAGAEVMSLLMDGLTPMSHVTEATADTAGIHMKTEIKSAVIQYVLFVLNFVKVTDSGCSMLAILLQPTAAIEARASETKDHTGSRKWTSQLQQISWM